MLEIIIISITGAAAAAYLIWILFIQSRKKSSCPSCPYSDSCKKQKGK